MKYFILINQQVLSKTNLDIIDGAILDYIYFYCNSQNEKVKKQRINDDGEIWTWIDYSALLKDMPMLKFKSGGILTLRINRIENSGYIKTKRFQHMKKYFRMTAKSDGLFIQMNRAIHPDEQGYSISRTDPIQSGEPIKNKNNKDKKIKNIVGKADEKNFSQKETSQKESEPFDSRAYVTGMTKDARKRIQIIGWFFQATAMTFPSLRAVQKEIGRHLKDAAILADYKDERVANAVEYVKKKFPEEWKLSTVLKYINKI